MNNGLKAISFQAQGLLTANDIAKWLNIPVSTVYDKTRQNQIPHVKIGRLIRYEKDQISEFVRNGGVSL